MTAQFSLRPRLVDKKKCIYIFDSIEPDIRFLFGSIDCLQLIWRLLRGVSRPSLSGISIESGPVFTDYNAINTKIIASLPNKITGMTHYW